MAKKDTVVPAADAAVVVVEGAAAEQVVAETTTEVVTEAGTVEATGAAAGANKAPANLTKTTDIKAGTVKFALGNGRSLVVCLDDLSPDMIRQAALHGLSQKIGDCAAGVGKNGKTFADAYASMADTLVSIRDDSMWNRKSAGGGEGRDATLKLATAIVAVQHPTKSAEEREPLIKAAYDKLEGMDKDERAELRKLPQVAAELADMAARAAKAKLNEGATASSLLAAF